MPNNRKKTKGETAQAGLTTAQQRYRSLILSKAFRMAQERRTTISALSESERRKMGIEKRIGEGGATLFQVKIPKDKGELKKRIRVLERPLLERRYRKAVLGYAEQLAVEKNTTIGGLKDDIQLGLGIDVCVSGEISVHIPEKLDSKGTKEFVLEMEKKGKGRLMIPKGSNGPRRRKRSGFIDYDGLQDDVTGQLSTTQRRAIAERAD